MLKKLIITPWFGPLPPWMDKFLANFETLKPMGYDLLLTTNLDLFNERCEEKLGFRTPVIPGQGKLHDYRPLFGHLFEKEIKGYDFWGHTDFDCVFGNVAKFLSDWSLTGVDVYADCPYVCGPWTLYANHPVVNFAYRSDPTWEENVRNPATTGWGEESYTRTLEKLKLRFKRGGLHHFEVGEFPLLRYRNGELLLGDDSIMMFHFRRIKEYPIL